MMKSNKQLRSESKARRSKHKAASKDPWKGLRGSSGSKRSSKGGGRSSSVPTPKAKPFNPARYGNGQKNVSSSFKVENFDTSRYGR